MTDFDPLEVISKGSPIAPFQVLKDRAVGLFRSLSQQRLFSRPVLPSRVVGVDLGQSHLLVLGVEKKLPQSEISSFRLEARPPTPEAVTERLRTIFKEEGLDPKGVRVALKGQGLVIRILTFPKMREEDFKSALQYEVEKYIPFKSNEVVFDFQILEETTPGGETRTMEVLLVAVRQSEIYELLRIFQNADLELGLIDLSAFAIANLLESLCPEAKEKTIGFLDMGSEISTLGILLRGKPVFIRDISFGGVDLLKLLERKLGLKADEVSALARDPARRSSEYQAVVEQGLLSFLGEFRLSMGYYLSHVAKAEPVETLFITGGGFRFFPQLDFLEREINLPIKRLEIFPPLEIHSHLDPALLRENQDLLPTALGLCLREL